LREKAWSIVPSEIVKTCDSRGIMTITERNIWPSENVNSVAEKIIEKFPAHAVWLYE